MRQAVAFSSLYHSSLFCIDLFVSHLHFLFVAGLQFCDTSSLGIDDLTQFFDEGRRWRTPHEIIRNVSNFGGRAALSREF